MGCFFWGFVGGGEVGWKELGLGLDFWGLTISGGLSGVRGNRLLFFGRGFGGEGRKCPFTGKKLE